MRYVSILAPPAGGAQRKFVIVLALADSFQSSLLPQEERNHDGSTVRVTIQCFNPRSSHRRSATELNEEVLASLPVSILAPPTGGAQRFSLRLHVRRYWFQSSLLSQEERNMAKLSCRREQKGDKSNFLSLSPTRVIPYVPSRSMSLYTRVSPLSCDGRSFCRR